MSSDDLTLPPGQGTLTSMSAFNDDSPRIPGREQPALGELLSEEPEKRELELAFLERLVQAFAVGSAEVLTRAGRSDVDFFASMRQMESPIFRRIARTLEGAIPPDATFGSFRKKTPD